ncbi:MAG TPA: L-rhamnose/proton symporter RhaT [Phycisphaerae bacterium]|nr:L-rhamnose/proton symporter RhaT [Phycisphaerae bacterium]
METVLGFAIMLAGAVCGGSFGLPSKYVRKGTPWEVLWGPFFLFVTILIPTALGPVIVKDFFGVYGKAGFAAMVPSLIFGLLWGLGSMTLGMSFAFIGLSLAYALNYGLQIATGALVPMLIHNADAILTGKGLVVIGGVVACLLGVVASGRAAMLKERSLKDSGQAPDAGADAGKPKMLIGVIIAIGSGVLCACYAVSASFAGKVGAAAGALGNAGYQATWAVMAMIVWGGAVSACLYCLLQLTRNKTWGHFAKPGIGLTLVLALVMAILHDGAIFLFGLGYEKLGELGISVGYAVFMSFAILVGNFHGFRTGEWKGASRDSICWLVMGVAILVLGVYFLGVGNSM